MCICKECKYFEPQKESSFGPQTQQVPHGNCHLRPPETIRAYGRYEQHYRVVTENDWCSYCTPNEQPQELSDESDEE